MTEAPTASPQTQEVITDTETDKSGNTVNVTTTTETWEDGTTSTTVKKDYEDGTSQEKKVTELSGGGTVVTETKTEANGDFARVTLTETAEGGSTIVTVDKTTELTQVRTYEVTGEREIVLKKQDTDSKEEKLVVPTTVSVNDVTYKVTSIDKNAFKGNKNLTSADIGNNVRSIGAGAFAKNTSLKSAKLGKKVKVIGANTFNGDSKLKTITIQSKVITKIGKKAFNGIASDAVFRIAGTKKQFNAVKKMIQRSGVGKKVKFKRLK